MLSLCWKRQFTKTNKVCIKKNQAKYADFSCGILILPLCDVALIFVIKGINTFYFDISILILKSGFYNSQNFALRLCMQHYFIKLNECLNLLSKDWGVAQCRHWTIVDSLDTCMKRLKSHSLNACIDLLESHRMQALAHCEVKQCRHWLFMKLSDACIGRLWCYPIQVTMEIEFSLMSNC